MGLITHNRIYVCIGASPCPVIVDLVIIDALALLHPHCAATVVATAQATAALCGQQPPYQGAATPTTNAVAPAGGRAGRNRLPLRPCSRVAAPCGLLPLRAAAPHSGPGRS
ncbi:hypothetical protein BHE74_00057875 [Ensete ventricosum]|nr:hypothetical protein BHE74_00057875 [Ensete ventricosum]